MTIYLDVDAALSEVPVNAVPLTDDTDFKTVEEGIAYNASGMTLFWHFTTPGGATTVTAVTPTTGGGDYDWAHQDHGIYTIEIPASGGASINNDTEGSGYFTGVCDGVLPWRSPTFVFRASGLNDLLIESAYSATRGLAGTALPAAAADAAGGLVISDAGGFDIDNRSLSAAAVTNANTVFDTDFATNYDAANDQWSVSASAVASVTGAVGSVTGAVGSVTGNVGGNVTGSVGSVLGGIDTSGGTITTLDALDTAQDSQHATTQAATTSILAKLLAYFRLLLRGDAGPTTDDATELTAINADAGAGAGDYDPTTDSVEAIRDRGDAAYLTATGFSTHSAANVRTEMDANSTQLAAILADTNELQTDWTNGGRLDSLIDGIKAVTDAIPNSGALTTIDSNIDAIKAVTDALPDSGALTSIAQADTMEGFFQLLCRSDAAIATDRSAILTLINADEGSGAGDFANTTDSVEALQAEHDATQTSLATAQADLDTITGADGVTIATGTQTFNMTGNITGNLSGSVGSVTGAVGSVTGNVGGNVTGSVGSVLGGIDTSGGTITTLDALDTAQDSQHATTQAATTSILAKLLAYFRLLLRGDAGPTTDDATELTAINADAGSGAGDYNPTTDSVEAVRDWIGDGTNLTEAGGDGDHLTEAGGTGDQFTAIVWNAAWDAEVQSEVTDALNAYDPPTRAELTTDTNSVLAVVATAQADLDIITGADGVTIASGNQTFNVAGSITNVTGGINTAAGTITTLDGLDTAQDTQHAATLTRLGTPEGASIAADIAALPLLAEIFAGGNFDGQTFGEQLKLIGAALFGKCSGMKTTTGTFRAADDSKTRITATIDSAGNRSAVTLDAS